MHWRPLLTNAPYFRGRPVAIPLSVNPYPTRDCLRLNNRVKLRTRNIHFIENIVSTHTLEIVTQDRLVRRNRIHLRPNEPQVPCDPQPLPEQPVIDSGVDVGNSAETIVPNPTSESMDENSLPPVQTSRYGRPIRPPKRLDLWNWRLECSMVLDVDYYLRLPVHIWLC